MKIQGLQKMTLLDFPGRVACTVFLSGCDFRCPFCHNFQLVEGPLPTLMEDDELFAFLGKRYGLLDGVAITGGEPCLRGDLPDFLARIRDAGFAVKLDTNGNHPRMLEHVLSKGLVDYVSMDVKNAPGKYAATVGLAQLDLAPINESIEMLMESGVEHEFRTTVVREFHESRDFEEIGAWIRGAQRYFLQSFTGGDMVPDRTLSSPEPAKLQEFRGIISPYVKQVEIRGLAL